MTITREKAIEKLKLLRNNMNFAEVFEEALDLAIESLSQPIVCTDYRIDKDHVYCSPELADMVYEALQKHTEDKQWTEETSR